MHWRHVLSKSTRRRTSCPLLHSPPKRQQRAFDFAIHVGFIVFEINGRRGAIILAHGVNGGGILEGADILGVGLARATAHVVIDAVVDQRFRKRRRLNQEEPMIVGCRKFLSDIVKKLVSGNNVDYYQLSDLI